MSETNEVKRVLGMSRLDLLEELGAAIPDDDFYGEGDNKERAVRWLEMQRGRLHEALCADDRWPKLSRTLDDNKLPEAFLLAIDGWLASTFQSFPLVTIGALLLHQGMDWLCGVDNDDK